MNGLLPFIKEKKSTKRWKLGALSLISATIAAASLVSAPPAGAEPAAQGVTEDQPATTAEEQAAAAGCPEHSLCLWQHINFRGRRLVFGDAGRWQDLRRYDFYRRTSSYWNRRNDDAAFQNYEGRKFCIPSAEIWSNMGSGNDTVGRVYLAHTDDNC